jgi:hypothetical protein
MPEPPPELPEKDYLMTRPDPSPLPAVQDPAERTEAASPRPEPPDGQGTDPRRDDIDYTA